MTKQQTLFVLLLTLMITPCLRAQKKELSQARSYIKSGKDFDKAEKLMTDLLAGSAAHRENKDIYLTWYQAVSMQYEAANEKLYLGQQYDTAAFFDLTRRMYLITESLDSLDARPDEKGRIRPKYRREHASAMNALRPNLFFGGNYHLRKAAYDTAFNFFDTYIDAARQPLFSAYCYDSIDRQRICDAAYWATYCGYQLHDAERTLKYSQLALEDRAKIPYTLQYLCEVYRWQQRDSLYAATLYEGFSRYPEHPYFFPRLRDYLTQKKQDDQALEIANKALTVNPQNTLFLLARSLALLNLSRYAECIETSEQIIALNDTLPDPYYNVATAYLNQALELENRHDSRKYRTELTNLYFAARPYMEIYRKLAPDDKKRWAPALYRIYFNLNMGKNFDEIDRLMKKL